MAPNLAERLRGRPAGRVEALVLPKRIEHGQLRQQHQLGRVANGVLAQRGPGDGQRLGLMRKLTDSDTHDRSPYQIRTRAAGARYSRCPGRTSNASYHGSRLRTVSARVSS